MTDQSASVSVVIPAFNAAASIRETINSALAQQDVEVAEILVVDDGSTDTTASIVRSVTDPRVKLISQANAGVAVARNTGMALAGGQWIALLDADDLWLPNKLSSQLRAAAIDPAIGAVQCGGYVIDAQWHLLETRSCVPELDTLAAYLRFQNLPMVASTWLLRRDLLDTFGPFNPGLEAIEDWDFSLRVVRRTRATSVPGPLAVYRRHDSNRSLDLDAHVRAGRSILRATLTADDVPESIKLRRAEFAARLYVMLSGGALGAGRIEDSVRWAAMALVLDYRCAGYLAQLPLRRFRRRSVTPSAYPAQLRDLRRMLALTEHP